MDKPSVLFILHLPPPVHGAANIGLNIKQSRLINNSFDCDYINLTTQANLEDMGKPNLKKVFVFLKLYYTIIKMLIKKRHQLCYVTINSSGPGFYKEMIIVFILKCFGRKIVYHYHNKGVRENSKKFVNNLLYNFQFKNSRVILLSPQLFYDVSKYLNANRVYFCNNGIAGVNNNNVKKNNGQNDPVVLLFVSNMFITKGVYVLMESCKILAEKKIPFICNFIGAWTTEITENSFIKKSQEYGIADFTKAHGPKFDEEKISYFKSSDIFVFPTAYPNEVFPLVNLEAMQYELPVISTNEGVIPEIIIDGYNGFIVPINDPGAIADKIITLINNKEMRNEMGLNGKRRFEEFYTLDKFEQNFKTTIQQVIEDFKK